MWPLNCNVNWIRKRNVEGPTLWKYFEHILGFGEHSVFLDRNLSARHILTCKSAPNLWDGEGIYSSDHPKDFQLDVGRDTAGPILKLNYIFYSSIFQCQLFHFILYTLLCILFYFFGELHSSSHFVAWSCDQERNYLAYIPKFKNTCFQLFTLVFLQLKKKKQECFHFYVQCMFDQANENPSIINHFMRAIKKQYCKDKLGREATDLHHSVCAWGINMPEAVTTTQPSNIKWCSFSPPQKMIVSSEEWQNSLL